MDALAATLWDESVVRSAYTNGPRLVSELDDGAHDEVVSSRAMSLLFCEVIELLLEVTDSEMLNTRIEDESNGRDADPTDRPA